MQIYECLMIFSLNNFHQTELDHIKIVCLIQNINLPSETANFPLAVLDLWAEATPTCSYPAETVKSNCRIYFPCLYESPHILWYPEEPSWSYHAFLQYNIRILWLVHLLIDSGSVITSWEEKNHRGTLESPYTARARCWFGCFHVHLHMHLR